MQCVGGVLELAAGALIVAGGASELPTGGISTLAVIGGVGFVGLGLSTVGGCLDAND